MASINAVVTGKIGPAEALTAAHINGLTRFELDAVNSILKLAGGSGTREYGDTDIDISAATTFTLVLASGVFTLTVS